VAAGLATDREVVAIDARGFGESGWSANKDYSHDAHIADFAAVADQLGWGRFVPIGASWGGGLATLFASYFPERTAAVVLVDYYPDTGIRHPGTALQGERVIGKKPPVFASFEAWLAQSSREKQALPGSAAHKRLEMFLEPVEGGYILGKRDPDFWNSVPLQPSGWKTATPITIDMWRQLAKVKAPTLLVHALRSAVGHTEEQFARMRSEYPHIMRIDVDSGHDVAGGAPAALVRGVHDFLEAIQV
jgi:pimeloyl-ACP methyl ester carboxylesterase